MYKAIAKQDLNSNLYHQKTVGKLYYIFMVADLVV